MCEDMEKAREVRELMLEVRLWASQRSQLLGFHRCGAGKRDPLHPTPRWLTWTHDDSCINLHTYVHIIPILEPRRGVSGFHVLLFPSLAARNRQCCASKDCFENSHRCDSVSQSFGSLDENKSHDFMKGRHGSLLSVGSVTFVTHWWLLDADWSNLAAFPLQAAVNQGDAAIGAS